MRNSDVEVTTRLRPGLAWHPCGWHARELAWILTADRGAGWVWFPHRDQLWFYPSGGFDAEPGLVIARLITDPRARETMRQYIRESQD